MRAAYQGEPGAYGEEAAMACGFDAIPAPTFAAALEMAGTGTADVAIIPVENSSAGQVTGASAAIESSGLDIQGEILHPVRHCLIGVGGASEVHTVYSHQQALWQCSEFIGSRRMVCVYDTAGAVDVVRELGAGHAAIAAERAAAIHGMPVMERGIQDDPRNTTRFLVCSRPHADRLCDGGKTTIAFTIPHTPGALARALDALGGANLTRIESRPSGGTLFHYDFTVDFEGNANLDNLGSVVERVRILGSSYGRLSLGPHS